MNQTSVITLENVSYQYPDGPLVLENISCSVERGSFTGIIGPNGGGKTTLLKLVLGLLSPTQGTVDRGNTSVGYVPQRSTLMTTLPATVQEVVESGRIAQRKLFHGWNAKDREAFDQALRAVGLEEKRNAPIRSLSGGQQQRVFLARALAISPDLLVLDEPAVGVDVEHEEQWAKTLHERNKAGLTILLVSHDLEAVVKEVSRLIVLDRSIRYSGTPEGVVDNSALYPAEEHDRWARHLTLHR